MKEATGDMEVAELLLLEAQEFLEIWKVLTWRF